MLGHLLLSKFVGLKTSNLDRRFFHAGETVLHQSRKGSGARKRGGIQAVSETEAAGKVSKSKGSEERPGLLRLVG